MFRDTTCDDDNRSDETVWVDGSFDLFHYGHANALRQARDLGGRLLVGVHTDLAIKEVKGVNPVLTLEERTRMVAVCRFASVVYPGTDYVNDPDALDRLEADFVAHGDDVCRSTTSFW